MLYIAILPFIYGEPLNVWKKITFPFYIHLLQVQITRRLTFKRTICTQATISTATFGASQLACQRGCSGSIGGSTLNCTDFMTSTVTTASGIDGWSAGEETYTYNLSITEPYFEALQVCAPDWVSLKLTIIADSMAKLNGHWMINRASIVKEYVLNCTDHY